MLRRVAYIKRRDDRRARLRRGRNLYYRVLLTRNPGIPAGAAEYMAREWYARTMAVEGLT